MALIPFPLCRSVPFAARAAGRRGRRRVRAAGAVAGVAQQPPSGERRSHRGGQGPAPGGEWPRTFRGSLLQVHAGGSRAPARRHAGCGPGLLRGGARIAGSARGTARDGNRAGRPPARTRRGVRHALGRARPRSHAPEAGRWRRSPAARRARTLAESGVDDEIRDRLEKLLSDAAVSGQGVGEVFLQINRFLAQQPEHKQVYELVRSLAKPYPANPEAHFAVAYAAFAAEIPASEGVDPALSEVNRALELKPAWERAALLKADILARASPRRGRRVPEAVRRRQSGRQARQRARWRRSMSSRSAMPKRAPFSRRSGTTIAAPREFEFGVAAISMQMKDWATAEALFTDLQEGRLRRERRRGTLPGRRSPRSPAAIRKRSTAISPCPKASARGSRSFVSRR